MVILIRKVIVFLCAKFHTQNDKYFDADVIIFDPEKEHVISKDTHHMNVDYSSYEGWKVTGKTETVLLRGQIAIENEECYLKPGSGQFVKRGKTSYVI